MAEHESITCPDCGMVSHNANDVREGYCGNCHAFTTADSIFLFTVELGTPLRPWQMDVVRRLPD